MRRDLCVPIAAANLPPGVAIVPFSHDIAPVCRTLLNSAYTDGFGEVVPFDQWWPALIGDSEYDPALCFIASAGVQIIGFCHCWTSSFVKDIAIDRAWLRRGVATALLTAAMREFQRRGAATIDLKTDVDNVVAQAAYLRLGFTVVERID
jgi:ribosomal protein S18 acetylase RimI-like enzyme